MASAASGKTAAICCVMLILTMGQLTAAAALPHRGSRHLLQRLAGVEASNLPTKTTPRAPGSQGLKNAPVMNTALIDRVDRDMHVLVTLVSGRSTDAGRSGRYGCFMSYMLKLCF